MGYVLTVLAIGALAALVWLGARTQSQDPARAAVARAWLRQTRAVMLVLVLAIVFLPIGKRPGVNTSAGAVGPAKEATCPIWWG